MNVHQLAEERSLAYHQAIASRLPLEPELLARARQRVESWLAQAQAQPPFYALRWSEILTQPPATIAAFLTDRGELATELRQSSPFAGALRPAERWKIWRETRAGWVGQV